MNIVSVSGNVGGKVTLRQTQAGENVLSFSVADNQIGKNPDGSPLPPLWWNCSLWGKRATSLQQYIVKGQPVTVNGNARLRQYQNQDGSPGVSLDLRVIDIALQGGRQDSEQPPQQYSQPQQPQQRYGQRQQTYGDIKGHGMKSPPPPPQRPADESRQAGAAPMGAFDDAPFPDDEIPF